MTRDEIISMAREAGFHPWYCDPERAYHFETITKFARLVESAHETRAQSAYSRGYACGIAAGDVAVENALRKRDDAVKALAKNNAPLS